MLTFPFSDNVLYEGIRKAQQEDTLIREFVDFPRNAIQITGGAQHNEAIAYAARFKRDTPTKRAYYRFSDDDNVHQRETPTACAARLASYAALGLIPSYSNEPTKGELIDVVTHAMQTMRLLKDEHHVENCLMLNWNTGFIDNLEKQWRSELNDLYTEMRRIGYTGGFHEYMNTRFFDDPAQPLYIGRYRYVLRRFPGLKVCISEFGFDSHAPNPQIDGYKNHKAIWEILFPGKSLAQVYFQEAVKADATIYTADGIEDILFFCRGHNLTGRWVAFNYQHDTEFINKKKVYGRVAVMDYGTRTEGKAGLVNATRLKIRPQPNTIQKEVGLLEGGEILTYWSTPVDGWYKIEWQGVERYVSAQYIRFEDVIDPHPPVALPLPDFDIDDRVHRVKLAAWWRQIADLVEHGVKRVN